MKEGLRHCLEGIKIAEEENDALLSEGPMSEGAG
jgi:hypothetical protein